MGSYHFTRVPLNSSRAIWFRLVRHAAPRPRTTAGAIYCLQSERSHCSSSFFAFSYSDSKNRLNISYTVARMRKRLRYCSTSPASTRDNAVSLWRRSRVCQRPCPQPAPLAHPGPVLGSGAKQATATIGQKVHLEYDRLKILFANSTMTRLTILLWIIYMFDYWSFTIAGSFLPTIIKRKGADLGLSLISTYRSYVYIYIFGKSHLGWSTVRLASSSTRSLFLSQIRPVLPPADIRCTQASQVSSSASCYIAAANLP